MMDSAVVCIKCRSNIAPSEKAIGVFLFAQTSGIRPRRKSRAGKISFCPGCAVSLAMGPAPEGAVNQAAWWVIRNLVSADPGVTEIAWEKLSRVCDVLISINSQLSRPQLDAGDDGAHDLRSVV